MIEDQTSKDILNRIQADFPIHPRPYKVLAEELGLSEDQLIDRIEQMKQEMIIRRIGGNFSPDRLGFYSTLCAARVEPDKIELFTRTVNAFSGVTHNYQRNHQYNIWFTFIAPSVQEIKERLETISQKTGVTEILNLPATHVFKIAANFKV
ncbi:MULTISPECIES: AsnC family transcriptional regulator [Desulfobacter]|jgi:DNA-binding Lrp family transcriptional regulator|uniref:siroheme decarboxylase n=1 Tax=Desulfobacter postgatei 2ac9 TaxID=879212 RepID=I5B1K1_9BACT|nr:MULTISPECIES: AsnC family transcriptional regulator [Desulfobacter]EIM63364.1 transcriptional regulator [Desulfobacter postgatei 2ac9]MBP8829893.1 AsnC family transcriptional regulator [Desulfobacter sp.]MBP9599410.1 AsnC family transcriptional regulator [Desulfobacter sp.]MDD4273820.1 AsnC family transcriptional regulator [Desulfobacter postgatei]MDX9962482.1 AsnC family transcriptional regulator [Desulfobacter postgatei]